MGVNKLKYYICDNCHFQFERVGICEKCPDCGKTTTREPNKEELERFLKIKEEMKKTDKKYN